MSNFDVNDSRFRYPRCIFFILLLCVGGLTLSGCDSGGESSPDPELIDGAALAESEESVAIGDAEFDVAAVATHEDGDWLTAFSQDGSGRVTEAVYSTSDGERVTVRIDEQGRPTVGVAGSYVLGFGNYDGSRADVAVLNTDNGEITTYEDVDLGIDPTKNLAKQSGELTPAEAFDAASVGITAFICTAAFIDPSGFSATACGASILLEVGTRALQQTEWGETAQWVGFGIDGVECADDYGLSCLEAFIDAGSLVFEEDESQIEKNKEDVAQAAGVARFGGTWAYRDLNQGWFVMEETRSYDAIYDSDESCYQIIILDFLEVDGNFFRYERRSDGFQIEAEFELEGEDVLTATRLNDGSEFTWDRDSSQDTQTFFDNECPASSVAPASRLLSQ